VAKATKPAPPPTPGLSPMRIVLGMVVLLGLNYVFTDLLDESGLPVLMVTARLPQQPRNATREALYLADASAFAAARVANDPELQRLDILQLRPADAATTDATYSFLEVLTRGSDVNALPEYLTAPLRVETTVQLRTLFPERTRWRQMTWQPKEGELPELGSISLLVEQTTYTVEDEAAAHGFARAWSELGYNSLGEPGVVRCDLLQEVARPQILIARKIFRGTDARREHEASPHLAQWRERVGSSASVFALGQLDTIFPRSSPFPFRSGWTTV